MAKLRPQTIRQLHGLLARASGDWTRADQPESLRRYVLGYGAGHLRAAGDHEGLWQMLRDEDYRHAQLDAFRQYEASYRTLRAGIELYVARAGQTPEDDARLCWLALRAGGLAHEATSDIRAAFDWARERPLEDLSRMRDALERVSVLDELGFYMAALLLLWIEVDRQAARPEAERSEAAARLVLKAIETRIPAERGLIHWPWFLSVDFMRWLTQRVFTVLPGVALHEYVREIGTEPESGRGLSQTNAAEQTQTEGGQALTDGLTKYPHEALASIATMGSDSDKAAALVSILEAAAQTGGLDQLRALVEQARQLADTIAESPPRTWALAAVAQVLAYVGELHEAVATAHRIADHRDMARALAYIVVALVARGDIQEAMELAATIRTSIYKVEALASIAEKLASTEAHLSAALYREALQLTATTDYDEKAWALSHIAVSLAQMRGLPEHAAILQHALESVLTIGNRDLKSETLSRIAQALARSGETRMGQSLFEHAIQPFVTDNEEARDDSDSRDFTNQVVIAVATALAQKGDLHGAITAAGASRGHDKSRAMCSVVQALVWRGDFRRALDVAEAISGDFRKGDALSSVAQGLARAKELPEREAFLQDTIQAAHAISDPLVKIPALSSIARSLADAGESRQAQLLFQEALASIDRYQTHDSILDVIHKSYLLESTAQDFAHAMGLPQRSALFEQALTTAYGLDHRDCRAATLSVIAGSLAHSGEYHLAFATLENIEVDSFRAKALSSTARALANAGETEQSQVRFREAFAITSKVDKSGRADGALCHVVEELAQVGGLRDWAALFLSQLALEVVPSIVDADSRASVLSSVSRALARVGETRKAQAVLQQALNTAGQALFTGQLETPRMKHPQSDTLGMITEAIVDTNQEGMFHRFARSAVVPEARWPRFLHYWRWAVEKSPSQLYWLRQSLSYHPFSTRAARSGVRYLALAHLRAGHREVFDAIVRFCPQLGSDVPLPNV